MLSFLTRLIAAEASLVRPEEPYCGIPGWNPLAFRIPVAKTV